MKLAKSIKNGTYVSEDWVKDRISILQDYNYWRMFEKIYNDIRSSVSWEDANKNDESSWPPIQTHPTNAVGRIAAALMVSEELGNKKPKFLDCGCGAGNILHVYGEVASRMLNTNLAAAVARHGWAIDGIELRRDVAKLGNMMTPRHCNIYCSDLLKFRKFKEYNIIYYYFPIKHKRLEVLFEEILEDSVKVGTIIVPNCKMSNAWKNDKRFIGISTNLSEHRLMLKVAGGMRTESDVIRSSDYTSKEIPGKYEKIFEKHISKVRK